MFTKSGTQAGIPYNRTRNHHHAAHRDPLLNSADIVSRPAVSRVPPTNHEHALCFQYVIDLLVTHDSPGPRVYQSLFALRMVNTRSREVVWLHQDTSMFEV